MNQSIFSKNHAQFFRATSYLAAEELEKKIFCRHTFPLLPLQFISLLERKSAMRSVSSSSAVTRESVHVFVFSMLILIESSLARRRGCGGGDRISSSDCAAATRPFARRRLGTRLAPPPQRLSPPGPVSPPPSL